MKKLPVLLKMLLRLMKFADSTAYDLLIQFATISCWFQSFPSPEFRARTLYFIQHFQRVYAVSKLVDEFAAICYIENNLFLEG